LTRVEIGHMRYGAPAWRRGHALTKGSNRIGVAALVLTGGACRARGTTEPGCAISDAKEAWGAGRPCLDSEQFRSAPRTSPAILWRAERAAYRPGEEAPMFDMRRRRGLFLKLARSDGPTTLHAELVW